MYAESLTDLFSPLRFHLSNQHDTISHLLTDSRLLVESEGTLFFGIPTRRNDGARYLLQLYDRGVRNFVVGPSVSADEWRVWCGLEGVNIWQVDDVVAALQSVAARHRRLFDIPVVGITGSNGKTVVKEWMLQLLAPDHHIAASPQSYNSQIGVPLSVWRLSAEDDLAIFEAGISQPDEMRHLCDIILPTIGLFTNIGQAHDENFASRRQKIEEKLRLFSSCSEVVYCADHYDIDTVVAESGLLRSARLVRWGEAQGCDLRLLGHSHSNGGSHLEMEWQGYRFSVDIPFSDRASCENVMHCVTLMLLLGYQPEVVSARCAHLMPVAMRLELNEALNRSLLINDSYSLDIDSLAVALDMVSSDTRHERKLVVLSDFEQAGMPSAELYAQVAALLRRHDISRLVGIGPELLRNRAAFNGMEAVFYPSAADFLHNYDIERLHDETILLKGARNFRFEEIAKLLRRRSHETVMEVNLSAMIHNLNYYRSLIKPTTKLMAMVKAASYGAGTVEVANALQYNRVDYLTVAYIDEGVELRRNGISLPIMVMNPEENGFSDMLRHNLEPDIYGFRILDAFARAAQSYHGHDVKVPIHVEFDTGMHRLGFDGGDVARLAEVLGHPDCPLRVCSIFSHLACSDDPAMDDFTRSQIEKFRCWSGSLKQLLHQPDICSHILNSSGIARFPEAQMDMVRLGIGLYGVAPEPEVQAHLRQVSRLVARVSQLKPIPQGDSVGYNRRWIAPRDSKIAILSIGYADGLSRQLGYGRGQVMLNGHRAPIIGSICMDMCFVDVTGIDCREGDEVVVYGDSTLLQDNAQAAGSIPYELLTSVSPRVKRVYYQE